MRSRDLLVVAGEASGDLHGGRLLGELVRLDPELRAFGLGGDELARAGLEQVEDVSAISVVGIAEAISVLARARSILDRVAGEVERRRPAAAILVDFPEFNLRLARRLAWLGVPVVYYVSPQVWAWRRGRLRTIADLVDLMLVLFPFELPFYQESGVRAVHVGHPLVDEVPRLARRTVAEGPARIALLPGSRRSEIRSLLPTFLAAAELLGATRPVEFVVIRAPTVAPAELADALSGSRIPLRVASEDRLREIADSDLAWVASGTATLEVGLLGTPMIVAYRLHPWTHLLAHALVDVEHFSLVNLVLERPAVPELMQQHASPEAIARESARLLTDRVGRNDQLSALAELRERLGAPGASRRAAEEIRRFLHERRAA